MKDSMRKVRREDEMRRVRRWGGGVGGLGVQD